ARGNRRSPCSLRQYRWYGRPGPARTSRWRTHPSASRAARCWRTALTVTPSASARSSTRASPRRLSVSSRARRAGGNESTIAASITAPAYGSHSPTCANRRPSGRPSPRRHPRRHPSSPHWTFGDTHVSPAVPRGTGRDSGNRRGQELSGTVPRTRPDPHATEPPSRTGAAEPAPATVARWQLRHRDEPALVDPLHDELGDTVAAAHRVVGRGVGVHEDHPQLVPVTGVDQPRGVEARDPVAQREPAAGQHEARIPVWDRDRDP